MDKGILKEAPGGVDAKKIGEALFAPPLSQIAPLLSQIAPPLSLTGTTPPLIGIPPTVSIRDRGGPGGHWDPGGANIDRGALYRGRLCSWGRVGL